MTCNHPSLHMRKLDPLTLHLRSLLTDAFTARNHTSPDSLLPDFLLPDSPLDHPHTRRGNRSAALSAKRKVVGQPNTLRKREKSQGRDSATNCSATLINEFASTLQSTKVRKKTTMQIMIKSKSTIMISMHSSWTMNVVMKKLSSFLPLLSMLSLINPFIMHSRNQSLMIIHRTL